MLVKSFKVKDHVKYLEATFQILRQYMMMFNIFKCTFGITFEKFIGYMVN